MTEITNSFIEWTKLARESPELLADYFKSKYNSLSPESKRALIASIPKRETLIENIKTAFNEKDAVLAGVPYFLQDLFDVEGLPTSCGAPFQDPFEAVLEDSSLLERKLKNLGGILLAKCTPSEFGVDLQGRNKSFGDCPHADGLRFICGGGAGSCAHAVSKGFAPLAFGLDSSAGIRIPGAFHGLFGFRMSNNAYAREGTLPTVPSLESVGWLTAQLEDLATTIKAFYPAPLNTKKPSLSGYLLQDSSIPLDPDLKQNMMSLVRHFHVDEAPDTNKSLCNAFKDAGEAFTTIKNRELYSIHKYWIEEYRSDYDEALLQQIEAGQNCTAEQADHATAIQQNIRRALDNFFREYDYLILPISTTPTPTKSEWSEVLENDLVRLNAPASLTFLPAIILPFPCDNGRHSAVQLIFNPRKIPLAGSLFAQLRGFYG